MSGCIERGPLSEKKALLKTCFPLLKKGNWKKAKQFEGVCFCVCWGLSEIGSGSSVRACVLASHLLFLQQQACLQITC